MSAPHPFLNLSCLICLRASLFSVAYLNEYSLRNVVIVPEHMQRILKVAYVQTIEFYVGAFLYNSYFLISFCIDFSSNLVITKIKMFKDYCLLG